MNHVLRAAIVLTCLAPSVCDVWAVDLQHANRVSIHPIEPTVVTVTGNRLRSESGECAHIWTSFPATVEPVDLENKDRNRVTYRITPIEKVSGIVAIRAYSETSISRPLLFTVNSQPVNEFPQDDGAVVDLPSILEGRSVALGEHRIAINGRKGERFVAEVVGARVGSEMDAVLVVYDSQDREVAFADDHRFTGADPVLEFTPASDGICVIAVRDLEYRGSLPFQLRLSSESASLSCFPNALTIGETTSVELTPLFGRSGSEARTVSVAETKRLGFSHLQQADDIGPVRHVDLPVSVESERNEITLPAVFCGRLSKDDEKDEVFLVARKGDPLTISVENTGGPFVAELRLFRGETLLQQQHWGRDPYGMLRVEIPDDDTYRLEIRDALHRGGPGFEYCLSVRNDRAFGSLRLGESRKRNRQKNPMPHRFVLTGGQKLPLGVRFERRGMTGAVRIHAEVDGAPAQVDGVIPEGKSDAEILVTLPTAEDGLAVRQVLIFGTCDVNGRTLRMSLDMSEYLKRDFPVMNPIPTCVASMIPVVVTPEEDNE